MPPPIKSTIQNRSRHQLVIQPTFTHHNDWRCPPSKNRQVTSWKIWPNATTEILQRYLQKYQEEKRQQILQRYG
ncbi:hypothetical protein FH972_017507 [Carpinus fangiana]|uniref:Uncharacterized protein n=1 Tax=Carpinus fangiana TaxID=176857 RepID=A0A5N6RJD9_9ROSI|nr:hypothetical protein FH972_017507 [Carpinus fangiana]